MDAATLDKRLRKRAVPALMRKGDSRREARRRIAARNCNDMLWSHFTCARCEQNLVPDPAPVIARVRDDDEFVEAAFMLRAAHGIEDHGDVIRNCAGETVTADSLRDSLRYYLGEVKNGQPFGRGQTVWDAAETWVSRRWASAEYEVHPAAEAGGLSELVRRELHNCRGLDNHQWLFVFSPGSVNPLFVCREDWAAMAVVDAKLGRMAADGGGLVFSVQVHFPGSPLAWLEFRELAVAPRGKPATGAAEQQATPKS
jgi:hypothetical protein